MPLHHTVTARRLGTITLAELVARLCGLALVYVAVDILGATTQVEAFLAAFGFVGAFSGLQHSVVLPYFIARASQDPGRMPDWVASANGLLLAIGLTVGGGTSLCAPLIAKILSAAQPSYELVSNLRWAGIWLMLVTVSAPWRALLAMDGRPIFASLLTAVTPAATILALVIAPTTSASHLAFAQALSALGVAMTSLAACLAERPYCMAADVRLKVLWESLKQTKWLLGMFATFVGFMTLDVSAAAATGALGVTVYRTGTQLAYAVVFALSISLASVVGAAVMSARTETSSLGALAAALAAAMRVALPAATATAVVSWALFCGPLHWMPSAPPGTAAVALAGVLLMPVSAWASTQNRFFDVLGLQKQNFWLYASALALRLVITVPVAKAYGLVALVFVQLISMVLTALVQRAILARRLAEANTYAAATLQATSA